MKKIAGILFLVFFSFEGFSLCFEREISSQCETVLLGYLSENNGSIQKECKQAKKEGEACCVNPSKCEDQTALGTVAKELLGATPQVLSQLMQLKIGFAKTQYKACQYTNVSKLLNPMSATLGQAFSGGVCSKGVEQCESFCKAAHDNFSREFLNCFSPFGDTNEIGDTNESYEVQMQNLLNLTFNDNNEGCDDNGGEKATDSGTVYYPKDVYDLLDEIQKAYGKISKEGQMPLDASYRYFSSCGEILKLSQPGHPRQNEMNKNLGLNLCQRIQSGDIALPEVPVLPETSQPSNIGIEGLTGSESSSEIGDGLDNGPGEVPDISDNLPLSDNGMLPGVASGFVGVTKGSGGGGGDAGGLSGGGGGSFAGNNFNDYEGYNRGLDPGFDSESWGGSGNYGGSSGGGSYSGYDGDGGGYSNGGQQGDRNTASGRDTYKSRYKGLNNPLQSEGQSIFQMASKRIQDYCSKTIKQGCL